ncbi:hypothetical protein ACWGNE_02265 [Streptomyces xiamenensis]
MTEIVTAVAEREGTTPPNADAAHTYTAADGTTAAAVVDGIGHSPAVVHFAPLAAEVIVRIAATRGGLAGLLTAAELVADPGAGPEPEADAVAVVAVAFPGEDTIVNWVGDARAYAWNEAELRQYTTDHTVARQLSESGIGPEIAAPYGAWVRTSLARSSVATVREVVIPAGQLVILTSDGVHDQVPHEDMVGLVRRHGDDPQVLAGALVAAARAGDDGARDDATAVVIRLE